MNGKSYLGKMLILSKSTHREPQLAGSEAGSRSKSWEANSEDSALRGGKDTHLLQAQTDQNPEFCTWAFCMEGGWGGKKKKKNTNPKQNNNIKPTQNPLMTAAEKSFL